MLPRAFWQTPAWPVLFAEVPSLTECIPPTQTMYSWDLFGTAWVMAGQWGLKDCSSGQWCLNPFLWN